MAKKKPSIDEASVVSAAREGLAGAAPTEHIGELHSVTTLDGVHTVLFSCLTPGYPGWNWVVTLSDGDGGALGVLETHLLPGEGALLAPDWVPWADRLEEYQRLEAERESDDPSALEIPEEPNDVFDHVDLDED
jgi:hypothetical protein